MLHPCGLACVHCSAGRNTFCSRKIEKDSQLGGQISKLGQSNVYEADQVRWFQRASNPICTMADLL